MVKPVHYPKFLNYESYFLPIHFFPEVLLLRIRCNKLYFGPPIMCPRYSSFHLLMQSNNSLLCPILSSASSFLILIVHEIFRNLLYNKVSNSSILFSVSFVNIHISQPQERTDQTHSFKKCSLAVRLRLLLINNVHSFIMSLWLV